MPASVAAALTMQYPCSCDCHELLSLDERTAGIEALYRFDDAMRGWGYTVIWDLAAPVLWRLQQEMNAADNRWVCVRDEACVYSRLVGFCVHELVHAITGDVGAANYGVPFGLPYGVPEHIAPIDEAAYLQTFNEHEARAWVGLAPVAKRLFGIEWHLRPARDVGTYGFPGGNAVVPVPAGFRRVPHYDSVQHKHRYYMLARRLEDEARGWFTPERLDEIAARFEAAEAIGRRSRPSVFPPARELARQKPRLPGANDFCLCGSGQKFKKCCAAKFA